MSLFGLSPLGGDVAAEGLLSAANPQVTSLDPDQEAAYRSWLVSIGQQPGSGYNVDDSWTGTDYDYRGFFRKFGPVDVKQGQHFTDEFKLPNHKTFSNESMYFNDRTQPFGGRWIQRGKRWVFEPFDTRLKAQIVE
jgi:hypothetical protein